MMQEVWEYIICYGPSFFMGFSAAMILTCFFGKEERGDNHR